MKSFLQRIAALIIVLLSLVWLCRAPDWEPMIAFVTALTAYLGLDFWQTVRGISAHDRELVERFLKLLPPDSPTASFLRSHDIAVPFPYTDIQPLFKINDTWKGIAFCFDDKKIEKARKRFFDKLGQYVPMVACETFPHDGNSSLVTMDFKDWDNPPEKIAARDRMNSMSTEVLTEYENLVRIIRNRMQ
jgi:hypothetical protein